MLFRFNFQRLHGSENASHFMVEPSHFIAACSDSKVYALVYSYVQLHLDLRQSLAIAQDHNYSFTSVGEQCHNFYISLYRSLHCIIIDCSSAYIIHTFTSLDQLL